MEGEKNPNSFRGEKKVQKLQRPGKTGDKHLSHRKTLVLTEGFSPCGSAIDDKFV